MVGTETQQRSFGVVSEQAAVPVAVSGGTDKVVQELVLVAQWGAEQRLSGLHHCEGGLSIVVQNGQPGIRILRKLRERTTA